MGQVVSVNKENVESLALQPAPDAPPVGQLLVYADSTTGELTTIDSSGVSRALTGASGGGSSPCLSFGAVNIPISNPLYPSASAISMSSGNTDLYTCPSSRLALCVDVILTNPTGNSNSITCLAEVKVSSTYHTFDFISNSLAAGSAGRSQSMAPFLLHAGESFSVNCDHSGGSAWASIIEFDSTANINDSRLFTLASGDNTVFTCPAGKTVQFVGFPSALNLPQTGWVWYWNASLGIRTVSMNAVPSGGSPAAANQIATASSISDKQMLQQQFYGGMHPGDFINVHTDSAAAAQTAWVIYTQQ